MNAIQHVEAATDALLDEHPGLAEYHLARAELLAGRTGRDGRMIHNPYIAGTFWQTTDGRRWLIGPAERWVSMDPATLGNVRQLTPDLVGAVQLHLAPVVLEDGEACKFEIHSWNLFAPGAKPTESYWIRCTKTGPHDVHEDAATGLTWQERRLGSLFAKAGDSRG